MGGFQIPNYRVKMIEKFDTAQNRFIQMNVSMTTALEAVAFVQVGYSHYIFLGGKSQDGAEQKCYSVDFTKNGGGFCKHIGKLREKKALHKAIYLGGSQILILGGTSYPVEVFDYVSGKAVTNHACINVFMQKINQLGIDKAFKKYLVI